MKNRRLLAAVLVMTVVMSFLSACGSSAPKETAAAETTAAEITAAETKEETTAAETTEAATEPEKEEKKEFPIEGEYTLFAAEEEGDRPWESRSGRWTEKSSSSRWMTAQRPEAP